MMKKFRGRSLAHPGCLIGVTAGLTFGIVLAGILAIYFNMALSMLLVVWISLTIVLGTTGWVIGNRLSAKFPAMEEVSSEER